MIGYDMYDILWHLHNHKLDYTYGTREIFPDIKIRKASQGYFIWT